MVQQELPFHSDHSEIQKNIFLLFLLSFRFIRQRTSFPLFLQSKVTFQQISEEEAKLVANVVPPLMPLLGIWTTNGCHFALPGFLRVKAGRISLTLIGFTVMLCDTALLWSQTARNAFCSQSGEFWEMGKWETATCQDPEKAAEVIMKVSQSQETICPT